MTRDSKGYFYSKLSVAYECLQKYKYLYVDKLDTPPPMSADLEFGTAVHAAIRSYLEGEDGQLVFEIMWNSLLGKGYQYSRFNHEELLGIGNELLRKFVKYHQKNFKPLHMEERLFSTTPSGILIEGTPDYIGEYKGELVLVDWKTSKDRYSKLQIECNDQMYLYAWLCFQQYGFLPKKLMYVVLIKNNPSIQTIELELTESKLRSMMDNVETWCKRLDAEREFPRNTKSCLKGQYACEMFERCYGTK